MNYSRQAEIFRQVKAKYTSFLASILWKLTGDRELFTEAMQYALLGMWQHVEKLSSKKAGAYIYRIALSANSKAWRNRIGRNGDICLNPACTARTASEDASDSELVKMVRRAITQLPAKQARAIVMRYLQQQDYNSIASELCCSEAGARSHVSKALASLKRKVATLTDWE
jgi:RNA polymerase sigma factor (sigma-70 family)